MTLASNTPQQCLWHSCSSMAEFEENATMLILQAAQVALQERGLFRIVLAGGNTPRNVYARLRHADTDWKKWYVYFGDERCLPPEHVERNSFMATESWLKHIPIPREQVYPIPAERGAELAAVAYSTILANVDTFDLVLLGLGEDGHTASLFPGLGWESAVDLPPVIAVHNAPKPPPDRVSLSPARLSAAKQVVFLVGMGKNSAVHAWQTGIPIPASQISPLIRTDVFMVL